jgi:hypothetical protein
MGTGSSANSRTQVIGPGQAFWNIRAPFKVLGLLDVRTHMSIIKLSTGKFLILDTVELDHQLKSEIDQLTDNGKNIEAVIGTHPFHTLAFPAFHTAYPNVPYYGTPRHLRKVTSIPWTGEISQHLNKWSPEVEMRIPAGAEYVNPTPELLNHFICVWVFSRTAKTLHVDDTVNCYDTNSVLLKITGKKRYQLAWHPTMDGPGLKSEVGAPTQFKKWVEDVLRDWDFDNICCAHTGNNIGGAHDDLAELVKNSDDKFIHLEHKRKDPCCKI